MLILPTKHIATANTALNVGALLMRHLERPVTVTALWSRLSRTPEVETFDRFVLALDFLYSMGLIDLQDGRLQRTAR